MKNTGPSSSKYNKISGREGVREPWGREGVREFCVKEGMGELSVRAGVKKIYS